MYRMTTQCTGLLTITLLLLAGCSPLAPQQDQGHHEPEPGSPEYYEQVEEERAQQAELDGQRAERCEPDEGEERFDFMPLGTYDANNEFGSGTMQMRDDYTFRLNWRDDRTPGMEQNVHANFLWEESGIGEAIVMCNVEAAYAGELMEDVGDSTTAVMGVDEENHSFRFNVPEIGEVEFSKAED